MCWVWVWKRIWRRWGFWLKSYIISREQFKTHRNICRWIIRYNLIKRWEDEMRQTKKSSYLHSIREQTTHRWWRTSAWHTRRFAWYRHQCWKKLKRCEDYERHERQEYNSFSLLTLGIYAGNSVVAVGILVVDVGCIDFEGSLDSLGWFDGIAVSEVPAPCNDVNNGGGAGVSIGEGWKVGMPVGI